MKFQIVVLAAALALSGCGTMSEGGTGTGTSLLGGGDTKKPDDGKASTASAIIAAMNGGLIKGSIGASLDESERASALEAEYRALEYTPGGQKVTWQGQNGRYGEVTAAQAYRVGSQDCRQYAHSVFSGGPVGTARGTACRNADGSWTPLT